VVVCGLSGAWGPPLFWYFVEVYNDL